MADIALLKCNLAIEPDLQNFVGFVLTTVHNLGGSTFAATPATLELARRLREAGAGSGYPLPAELYLNERNLCARWNASEDISIAQLQTQPDAELIE